MTTRSRPSSRCTSSTGLPGSYGTSPSSAGRIKTAQAVRLPQRVGRVVIVRALAPEDQRAPDRGQNGHRCRGPVRPLRLGVDRTAPPRVPSASPAASRPSMRASRARRSACSGSPSHPSLSKAEAIPWPDPAWDRPYSLPTATPAELPSGDASPAASAPPAAALPGPSADARARACGPAWPPRRPRRLRPPSPRRAALLRSTRPRLRGLPLAGGRPGGVPPFVAPAARSTPTRRARAIELRGRLRGFASALASASASFADRGESSARKGTCFAPSSRPRRRRRRAATTAAAFIASPRRRDRRRRPRRSGGRRPCRRRRARTAKPEAERRASARIARSLGALPARERRAVAALAQVRAQLAALARAAGAPSSWREIASSASRQVRPPSSCSRSARRARKISVSTALDETLEDLGDLGVRAALELAHDERRPLVEAEVAERAPDVVGASASSSSTRRLGEVLVERRPRAARRGDWRKRWRQTLCAIAISQLCGVRGRSPRSKAR